MNRDEVFHKRCAPEKLEILCKETGFDKSQIRSLYRAFKQACPSGAINETTFKSIYSQLFPRGADANAYGCHIFRALNKRKSGNLSFSELVRGLSSLLKGSVYERLRWIFGLYDINSDGKISRSEMSAVIRAVHDLVGPNNGKSETHADYVFQKFDLNSDGVITMDEFMTYCFNKETMFKDLENVAPRSVSRSTSLRQCERDSTKENSRIGSQKRPERYES